MILNLKTVKSNLNTKHQLFPKWKQLKKHNTMSKIIIVGPAASGKSTLAERMRRKGLLIGQLATTRPRRNKQDDEYKYTNPDDIIDNCQFRVKFNGWWYGLSIMEYKQCDVFIVGPEMLRQIRILNEVAPLVVIYLNIPEHIRYERLMKRDMPGDSVIGRIGRDRADFANFTDYTIMVTDPNF